MNPHSQALIVFIRNPLDGRVKTRIASQVGTDEAVRIYEYLVRYTLQMIRNVSCKSYLYYSDDIPEAGHWSDAGFTSFIQSGDDLGARMYNALRATLAKHERAILIGSDCPVLTADVILQGMNFLKQNDVVIGPSRDGGYYLIGVNRHLPPIFDGIEWGTSKVLATTLNKIETVGLRYSLLPELFDIDTYDDWLTYKRLKTD